MKVTNGAYLSIEQLQDQYLRQNGKPEAVLEEGTLSFQEILEQKQSKAEMGRLSDRNIELSGGQIKRLSDGARKAGERGIQESLVLMDELAFIVNIPNKTVVTAMDSSETQNNVFTNIDGAVIV